MFRSFTPIRTFAGNRSVNAGAVYIGDGCTGVIANNIMVGSRDTDTFDSIPDWIKEMLAGMIDFGPNTGDLEITQEESPVSQN